MQGNGEMAYSIANPPGTSGRHYHVVVVKDPNSVQAVVINWETMLANGDGLATAVSTAYEHGSVDTATTDITVDSTAIVGLTSSTVLSAGLEHGLYDILVRVTTDNGLTEDRTILITCQHK